MPLTHAAPDHSEADQHHLHRMGDDVLGAETLEAIDANLRHAGSGPFVKADREIEVLGCGPERLISAPEPTPGAGTKRQISSTWSKCDNGACRLRPESTRSGHPPVLLDDLV